MRSRDQGCVKKVGGSLCLYNLGTTCVSGRKDAPLRPEVALCDFARGNGLQARKNVRDVWGDEEEINYWQQLGANN